MKKDLQAHLSVIQKNASGYKFPSPGKNSPLAFLALNSFSDDNFKSQLPVNEKPNKHFSKRVFIPVIIPMDISPSVYKPI